MTRSAWFAKAAIVVGVYMIARAWAVDAYGFTGQADLFPIGAAVITAGALALFPRRSS